MFYYVKSVFSGPYFPVFGLNTEIYSVQVPENTDQKKLYILTFFTQCFLISCTEYLWKVETHNSTYGYSTNDTSLFELVSNPPSIHYKSRHFKIYCIFDRDLVKFSTWGVRKVLMHLLKFLLQRHNDVIFVTYKILATTDKKAATWIFEPTW